MDHPRVALRHHSLRLAGSLVVRLPVSSTLKYLFTSLERRPYHPEIPLKCTALALLSVQPSPTNKILTSSTPLIIRLLGLSGDYLSNTGNNTLEPLPTPRGIIVTDSCKDLIAIGTMIFCILSTSRQQDSSESLEDLFPKKLFGLLGYPLPESVADDICRRALQSDFPSLGSDPYLAELSSIAMENSLMQLEQPLKAPPTIIHTLESTSSLIVEKPKTPILKPQLSVPKLLLRGKVQEASIQINTSTPDSISSVNEEMYHPSWTASPDIMSRPLTIEHEIEGYSTTLDSPWTKIHETRSETPIDSSVDRTKLAALKRVGRKSASRRVRTANDIQGEVTQSDEWSADHLPATANARLVSVGEENFGNQTRNSEEQIDIRTAMDSPIPTQPISESQLEKRDISKEFPPKKRTTTKARPKIPLDPSTLSQNSPAQSQTTRDRYHSDDQVQAHGFLYYRHIIHTP